MKEAALEKQMPLLGHITELRKRLIISLIAAAAATIVSYALYGRIIEILYLPLRVLEDGQTNKLLYVNTIFEGFLTRLKISILAGIVLSLPVHFFNLIRFIFPGLTRKEKKIVSIALAFSFIFITTSFLYSYYEIIPISVDYLTGTGFIPERTGLLLGFSGNIFYVLQFMFAALVVFQIPIVLEVLLALKALSRKTLWRASRYVIVAIFILAAIVTPPDFITQLSLALPLTALYFLTLLIAKIFRFGAD